MSYRQKYTLEKKKKKKNTVGFDPIQLIKMNNFNFNSRV